MQIHLKKHQIQVLCRAYTGDSIISTDATSYFWRKSQTKLTPGDFDVLFEFDLMNWIDGIESGQVSNEGVITVNGNQLVEELDLHSFACSK